MDTPRDGEQLSLFDLPPSEKPAPAPEHARRQPARPSKEPASAQPARAGGRRVARRGDGDAAGRGKAYLFQVVLKWDRKVWRTIEVRGDQTLDHLHLAIQHAFGWDNDHLYSFFMSGKRWDTATEYADPRADDDPKADNVKIGALKLEPRKRFLYLFDYGDELLHDVWLVSVGAVEPRVKYPRVVKAHGDAPPQYPSYEDEG